MLVSSLSKYAQCNIASPYYRHNICNNAYSIVANYGDAISGISSLRHFSSNSKNDEMKRMKEAKKDDQEYDHLVKTQMDEGGKVATLILNRPPVNSLSLEMCTAISSELKNLENDHPKVQSLILSSSNRSVLSAGLDLTELYSPDPQRLQLFWNSFQQLFLDLYGSRFAVIGAIEGHAPAAGCMLAMACDYRIMASTTINGKPPITIGLNESKFGIAAPPWLAQLMIRTIGFRKAERALSIGTLFTPEEALSIGLVDEVVPTKDVMEKCLLEAMNWAMIPSQTRFASKMLARKKYLDELVANREKDTEHFCSFIQNDIVQARLGAYLESLKRK